METIVAVCLVTITVTLILLISSMFFVLMEIRRLNRLADRLKTQLEKEISPVIINLSRFSNDLATASASLRSQVERVDLTADHISKNLMAFVETCTKTGYLVHDAVAEPLVSMASFIKGVSSGLKFFLGSRER